MHTFMDVGREIVRPTIGQTATFPDPPPSQPMVGRTISRPTAIKVCIFHDFMAVQVMVGREIVRRTISWTATKSWKLFRLILSFFVV